MVGIPSHTQMLLESVSTARSYLDAMRRRNFGIIHGLTVLSLNGTQVGEEGSALDGVHESLRPVNTLQQLHFLLVNHSVDFLKHGIEELVCGEWKKEQGLLNRNIHTVFFSDSDTISFP